MGVRRALGQRYLMNDGTLTIRDGREYPVDLVAGFRKRQQNCPVKNVAIFVTSRATVTDGLSFFCDTPDMAGDQLEERALQAFGNTLPVKSRPCRIAQGIAHMREARVPRNVVGIDHQAVAPVSSEIPRIDLRTLGETLPGDLLPHGQHPSGQATFLLKFGCGHSAVRLRKNADS